MKWAAPKINDTVEDNNLPVSGKAIVATSFKSITKTYTLPSINAGDEYVIVIDTESKNVIGASFQIIGTSYTVCIGNFSENYTRLVIHNTSTNNTGNLTVKVTLFYI